MPWVSSGEMTSYSTGRVACSPSMSSARSRSAQNVTQTFHCGRKASWHMTSMNVAKASFSQMPSHHSMVTRSPNHMWAISCMTTLATRFISASDALAGSIRRSGIRYVMQPRFSIAPCMKSGIATMSNLSPG